MPFLCENIVRNVSSEEGNFSCTKKKKRKRKETATVEDHLNKDAKFRMIGALTMTL